MDVLSDIVNHLAIKGSLYFATEFSAPWGVLVPSHKRVVRFHLVTRGQCWARVGAAGTPLVLQQGDLILIPHGSEHALLDSPQREPLALDEVLARSGYDGSGCLVYGGEDTGKPTRLVCGHLSFDESSRHPFIQTLPQHIVVHASESEDGAWFDLTLQFLARESNPAHEGREAIIKRLAEILFIQAIRSWLQQDVPRQGVLAALADRRLGRSLKAVHGKPQQRWTVESLAQEANMSRTVFAERFKELVGMGPLHYVTAWRVEKARAMLTQERHSIEAVADMVGYRSLAAFNRVFKKYAGVTPGAFRRSSEAVPKA